MSFTEGYTAAIGWVWYVLGFLAAIAVGAIVLLLAVSICAVAFDVISDIALKIWYKAKGRLQRK